MILALLRKPLGPERLRSPEAQGAVRPVRVVLDPPVFRQHRDLEHRSELLALEELIAEPAVEGLTPAVLPGRSRVDERGTHAGEPAPIRHRVRGHLGAVVHPNMLRLARGQGDNLVEHCGRLRDATFVDCTLNNARDLLLVDNIITLESDLARVVISAFHKPKVLRNDASLL